MVAFLGAGCGGGSTNDGNSDATADDPAVSDDVVEGQLLVGLKDGATLTPALQTAISAVADIADHNGDGSVYGVNLKSGVTSASAQSAIAAASEVAYVEPNYLVHFAAAGTGADPNWAGPPAQYNAAVKAQVEYLWGKFGAATQTAVKVAVIDTGINAAASGGAGDLKNKVDVNGYDFTAPGAFNPTAVNNDVASGHGTRVAGILAAEYGNSLGIAGIASGQDSAAIGTVADTAAIKIVPVKVESASQKANHLLVAKGIDWIVNGGTPRADIILLSLGSGSPSYTLQKSIKAAVAAKILVIAAADNKGSSAPRWPAAYQNEKVLSVGSVDATDTIASDSSFGSWVNVLAPGVGLLTTDGDGTVTDGAGGRANPVSGTSYSAAFVAGTAAVLRSIYPVTASHATGKLTNDELRTILIQSADTYNHASSKVIAAKGGRLNVEAAYDNAKNQQAKVTPDIIATSVQLAATSTLIGSTVTGTVYLSQAPGVSGGGVANKVTVAISSSDTAKATTSVATLDISGTATSGTFKVTGVAAGALTIDAALNGTTVHAPFTVAAPGISAVTVTQSTVTGGTLAVTGKVTFNKAPSADATVTFTSSDATVIPNPSNVTVLAGKTSADFTFDTVALVHTSAKKTITLTATSGTSAIAQVVVLPPVVTSITLDKTATIVWDSGTHSGTASISGVVVATVKLSGKVKAADTLTVNLAPSDAVVGIPATVTFAGGEDTKTVNVQAEPPVAAQTVTLSASSDYGTAPNVVTTTKTTTLKVTPALASFAVTPSTILGAGSATGTVTLSAAAPIDTDLLTTVADRISITVDPKICDPAGSVGPLPAAAAVYLVNAAGADACTISSFKVAAGQKSASVTVKTRAATTVTAGAITASFLSVDKVATVTSSAPSLSGITLSAKSIAVNNSIAGTVTLSGNAVASTTVDLTLASTAGTVKLSNDNSTWAATAQVTISAGSSTGTFYVQGGTKAGTETVSAIVTGAPTASAKTLKVTVGAATLGALSVGGAGKTFAAGLQDILALKVSVAASLSSTAATTVTVQVLDASNAVSSAATVSTAVSIAKTALQSNAFDIVTVPSTSATNSLHLRATLPSGEYVESETFDIAATIVSATPTAPKNSATAAPGSLAVVLGAKPNKPVTITCTSRDTTVVLDTASIVLVGDGSDSTSQTKAIPAGSDTSGKTTIIDLKIGSTTVKSTGVITPT